LTVSGQVNASVLQSNVADTVVAGNNGNVYLRPVSPSSGTGEFIVTSDTVYARGTQGIHSSGFGLTTDTSFGTNPIFTYGLTLNPGWSNTVVYQSIHYPGVWVGAQIAVGSTTFQFRNDGSAYKPGGGAWLDSSDARIKNVIGEYTNGLDAIAALRPVRYKFKGNDTIEPPSPWPSCTSEETKAADKSPKEALVAPYANSPHSAMTGKEFIGLLAQEAEVTMPETVTMSKGHIDGVAVDDLRALDPAPLIFALINSCKELKARIEALEAASP
jgi:hypothetical protein